MKISIGKEDGVGIEELKGLFNQYLIKNTDFLKRKDAMGEDMMTSFLDAAIIAFSKEAGVEIPMNVRLTMIRAIVKGVESLGPLRSLMEDPSVTEIMINGIDKIYIQRNGKLEKTGIKFDSDHQIIHMVQKMLTATGTNKRIDESSPYVDFSLQDGSRVNVIIPPLAQVGPVVTIRKFKEDINSAEDLIALGELSRDMADFLIAAMKAKLNIVFCGSTGSGKTTALNVFSQYIPENERIITIEDTPELRLKQEHVVTLCTKDANIEGRGMIGLRQLFVNSLRMRPDRIIIGEVRGEEILDMIESVSSGHSGCLSIVHAESAEDCFNRMVSMMIRTGIRLTTEEIKRQIARAIDVIVHLELFNDGRRRITTISDVIYDGERQTIHLKNIFEFRQTSKTVEGAVAGEWVKQSVRPSFFMKFDKRDVRLPEGFFDV